MNPIDTFLELAVNQGGSDLHVISGEVPRIRINGSLQPIRFRELSREDVEAMLSEMMSESHRARLAAECSVDFAYHKPELGRFRVNVSRNVRGIGAVLRVIPSKIRALDELGLPPVLKTTIAVPKGLTLVTGPTGSGKSTTLAAMIDHINEVRQGHVITIEDPIEFIHGFKRCLVTQREVGTHAPSFGEALRSAVREDPDLILVGEMRDLETISLALTAAETGIQVFGTLHTNGTVRAIDRIINVFPARRHDQIRTILADTLRMIVAQQLVRKADGSGRLAAVEVLINTNAVASMVRTANSFKLASAIHAGSRAGMQALDAVLMDLVRKEAISGEEAYEHALDRTQFERYLVQDSSPQ